MSRAFAEITFTASVKAAQSRYGSRKANEAFERSEIRRDELTGQEQSFIQARDSFYMATISETGWPYVQFRGGPVGFLQVLDARTLAYADYRGNKQYISAGNIQAGGRVALILMDYPNRRRLKLWGQAKLVHEADDPNLFAHLCPDNEVHRVEYAVVIQLQAYDWNCQKHITPRFTEAEIAVQFEALHNELAALRLENAKMKQLNASI